MMGGEGRRGCWHIGGASLRGDAGVMAVWQQCEPTEAGVEAGAESVEATKAETTRALRVGLPSVPIMDVR